MMNETFAIRAIRYWFDASSLSSVVVTNFDFVMKHYRSDPGFLDRLGAIVRKVPDPDVKAAMEKLARSSGSSFPLASEFGNAIGDQVGEFGFGDGLKAAGEGIADAGAALFKLGAGSLLTYAAVAAFMAFGVPALLGKGSPKIVGFLKELGGKLK